MMTLLKNPLTYHYLPPTYSIDNNNHDDGDLDDHNGNDDYIDDDHSDDSDLDSEDVKNFMSRRPTYCTY